MVCASHHRYTSAMMSPARRFPALLICLALLGAASGAAQADTAVTDVDAREIIRKMDLLLRGDTSFGKYRMTITDPDWVRALTLDAWEKRTEDKTFIRILSPAKEAGIVTLKIDYEMWNYLPRV